MAKNTISLTFDTDSSLSINDVESLLHYLELRLQDPQILVKLTGTEAEVTNVSGYCTTPWTPNN
jgi:hypothetical protein